MRLLRISGKSFLFYLRKNLALMLGIAIGTAVITGALVVGDSVKYSLNQTVALRLGQVSHGMSAGDRYFTRDLASRYADALNTKVAPVLILNGMAVADGGAIRVDKVQIIGATAELDGVSGFNAGLDSLGRGEVLLSQNLAARLNVQKGDPLLLRIKKASLIPLNAPFVSDEGTSVAMRLTVKQVLDNDRLGRFDLKQSQTAPFNAFVNLSALNQAMETGGLVNTLLWDERRADANVDLKDVMERAWGLRDLGIGARDKAGVDWIELSSERVFLEDTLRKVAEQSDPPGQPVLTYFVNSIEANRLETPYSFVSSLPDERLGPGQI